MLHAVWHATAGTFGGGATAGTDREDAVVVDLKLNPERYTGWVLEAD
jgi:hypothetical protein